MVIIDRIYITQLRKIFPEISDAKIEVFTLFVYGMTRKDIANLKGVSVQAVSKALRELCDVYGVSKHDVLKTVYAIRLDLYNHLDCRVESTV
ncbi:conjugal transfer protein TraJ [Kosakonia sp. R1.Fl]|uniref:conjugal transfer protein TraJ n=1 Tax=Kosakonia sp. R1.Fl TaxID=2928706 RepID=UPI00201D9D4E|nr:conjugal transfer protein TraJ [Kosakonia sp. R1.Fl]MCL6746904.1 conjugal transfer protein TraJ [Kosakonia sp. R1.Fl]